MPIQACASSVENPALAQRYALGNLSAIEIFAISRSLTFLFLNREKPS